MGGQSLSSGITSGGLSGIGSGGGEGGCEGGCSHVYGYGYGAGALLVHPTSTIVLTKAIPRIATMYDRCNIPPCVRFRV